MIKNQGGRSGRLDLQNFRPGLQRPDVFRLPTLLAFGHSEFNRLPFFKAAISIALDRGEMHEDIFPTLTCDKTEAFSGVEPLNCSLFHFVSFPVLI
jgi:hypothetical protein